MAQLNKVISAFLLLILAGFLLWLLITKTQSIRNIFNGTSSITQAFSQDKKITPQQNDSPTPTTSLSQQSGLISKAQETFDKYKNNQTKGGQVKGVLSTPTLTPTPIQTKNKTPTQQPKPSSVVVATSEYPKTGAGMSLVLLSLPGFLLGKFITKKSSE